MMKKQEERKEVVMVPAPTVRNPAVEEFCGKNNLLIKDCSTVRTSGGFSSGTFKDYRSIRLVNDFGAKDPVLYSIVYATAGYSLGNVAREYNRINGIAEGGGIDVVSVIDEELNPKIKEVLKACSILVELPLRKRIFTRKEILDAVKSEIKNDERDYVDAENYTFSYTQLAEEIIGEGPDDVFMPLGGGEALNSLLQSLVALADSKVKLPRLYAATIRANVFVSETSPGTYSIAEKLVTPWSELAGRIKETLPRFGEVVVVEEDEIIATYHALKKAGIKAEPSAAVAFAAARKINCPEGSKVLIVNSGCGIYFNPDGILRGVSNGT